MLGKKIISRYINILNSTVYCFSRIDYIQSQLVKLQLLQCQSKKSHTSILNLIFCFSCKALLLRQKYSVIENTGKNVGEVEALQSSSSVFNLTSELLKFFRTHSINFQQSLKKRGKILMVWRFAIYFQYLKKRRR